MNEVQALLVLANVRVSLQKMTISYAVGCICNRRSPMWFRHKGNTEFNVDVPNEKNTISAVAILLAIAVVLFAFCVAVFVLKYSW